MIDAKDLRVGEEYHIPSGMGGVYTVRYVGLTPDRYKHMFRYVDWFSKQFSNKYIFMNDKRVETVVSTIS